MTYENALAILGLSQSAAESIVIIGIMAAGAGFLLFFFWHYIAIGAMCLGVLTVLVHHPVSTPAPEIVKVEPVEEIIQGKEVIAEPDPKEVEYVDRCNELTQNIDLCKEHYNVTKSNEQEIQLLPVERKNKRINKEKIVKASVQQPQSKVTEVKLLDVDNEEYKARRAEALKKPNAVVFQTTLR